MNTIFAPQHDTHHGFSTPYTTEPKRPPPPPRVYRSPFHNPLIVDTIQECVDGALCPQAGYQIRKDIPPVTLLEDINLPDLPATIKQEIAVSFFEDNLGLDLTEVKQILIKAKSYGETDPEIFGFGSVARTTCARLPNLQYKIRNGERRYLPNSSDLDIIVPSIIRHDPIFKRFQSATTVPVSSLQTPHESGLLCLKEHLVSEREGIHMDISILRTSDKSSVNILHLINALLPQQPLIRFWLDNEDIVHAEGIVITEQSPVAFDPQMIGIVAYSNAINTIAIEIANTDKSESKPTEQIYRHTRRISTHHPEQVLMQRFRDWSKATLPSIGSTQIKNPENLFTETRYLALASINVVNNTRRNLEVFEADPLKAIYYLGESGLLSLILQCSLFIVPSSNDVIERMCRIFIRAYDEIKEPKSKQYEHTNLHGKLVSLKVPGRYSKLKKLIQDVSQLGPINHNYKWVNATRDMEQSGLEPFNNQSKFFNLSLEIAGICPYVFNGLDYWGRWNLGLNETYLGAIPHLQPKYN